MWSQMCAFLHWDLWVPSQHSVMRVIPRSLHPHTPHMPSSILSACILALTLHLPFLLAPRPSSLSLSSQLFIFSLNSGPLFLYVHAYTPLYVLCCRKGRFGPTPRRRSRSSFILMLPLPSLVWPTVMSRAGSHASR